MRSGPVPVITALLVLSILPAGGEGALPPAEAPSIGPEVTLSLTPSTAEADVSFTKYGNVWFSGNAEVDRLPVDRCVVTLTSSVDTGWASTCSPSILAFSTNKVQSFQVTVSVPPGTLASLTGILTVTGEASGAGFSSTSTATANVTVAPYYLLRLQCESPHMNLSTGGKGSFKVELENRGNANDSFDIVIGNAEELRNAGWAVRIVRPSIPFVGPGSSMPFYVEVEAPRSLSNGGEPASIAVMATSTGSKTPGPHQSSDIHLYVKLRGGIDDPLNRTMILVVVIAMAVAAALAWRWRRKRKGRIAEAVVEEPA